MLERPSVTKCHLLMQSNAASLFTHYINILDKTTTNPCCKQYFWKFLSLNDSERSHIYKNITSLSSSVTIINRKMDFIKVHIILVTFILTLFIDVGLSSPGQRTSKKVFQSGPKHDFRRLLKAKGIDLQAALHKIRDSKKKEIPEERKRTLIEKIEEKRNNVRVSFRECNLETSRRLDCGHYGINAESCSARECCWGETTEPDVPWCYHSIPTISSQCLLDVNERQECGSYGIRKEQCLAKDCCWQPSADGTAPWCFEKLRVPIFAGECGVPAVHPSVITRIVGGVTAREHSWPWMVSLQIDQDHFCGGTLINNQWIVSAAHCEPAFNWGRDKEIVLGMHSQSSSETTKVRVEVDELFGHENYGQASGMDNDILLIKLKTAVEFTDAISPVCLPEQDSEVSPGRRCYTTGWGHTRFGGSAPDLLQQVMVPIIEPEVCNQGQWYGGQVDDTMICAGYEEGGRDSCQGDSGGPLVCYESGKWILTGIVSWGDGCASERKPGIYAKTSKYNQWIENTINANLD